MHRHDCAARTELAILHEAPPACLTDRMARLSQGSDPGRIQLSHKLPRPVHVYFVRTTSPYEKAPAKRPGLWSLSSPLASDLGCRLVLGRLIAPAKPLACAHDDIEQERHEKQPTVVEAIMPPITPMPMAFCAAEPAPVAMASGVTPRMKASDVMMIGRRRMRAACSAASIKPSPAAEDHERTRRSEWRSWRRGRWS